MNDPDRWYPSDGLDDDAIFADIVAHLNDDVAEDPRAAQPPAEEAPPSEDATEDAAGQAPDAGIHEAAAEAGDNASDQPMAGDPRASQAPFVWRAHEVDDDYEDHFEPPPVAPLPVGDLQFWAIIAGMVGGPLLLLYLVFFNRDAGSYWMLSAIAMSVAGFALLISRLPGHDDDDDGARL